MVRHLGMPGRWLGFRTLELSPTRIVPGARGRQASRLARVADLEVGLAVSGLSHGVLYVGLPAVCHRSASYVFCRCHTRARHEVDGAWAVEEQHLRVGPSGRYHGHRNWTWWDYPK
jgi:hypothetical protein